MPAASAIAPTSAVTVLLPLLPVMPMTGALAARANSSMSPISSTLEAFSAAMNGSSSGTPGETTAKSNCEYGSGAANEPIWNQPCGSSARSTSMPGGSARESVRHSAAPSRAR